MYNTFSIKNKVSPLKYTDFRAAFKIECDSNIYPWSAQTFLSNYGKCYYNLKLEYNNILTAFAITQVICKEATLFNIAVTPSYQRQGLGRKLFQELISDLVKKKNILKLWLEVRDSNHLAIAFYESMGFNEVSIRKCYYPTLTGWEDARIMALSLAYDKE
ncbi:ribosomal protein S18-alanine N-acetyltransferase [Candidatus Profftia sp. (ex Adelges kitamiensis)]|uniref:ribosomal protein S18-alanine N-acetyltransferase n=1 Tax=Candidatus Profftia sp. (ex Adelges kitamiensis) TaxID=2864218 RepID=UPI001CE3035E|nr:ribosomal protein S18-alanine N-acetyltransferase [Candidatus Profftia sp. (ex Adelges kitamiensis)]